MHSVDQLGNEQRNDLHSISFESSLAHTNTHTQTQTQTQTQTNTNTQSDNHIAFFGLRPKSVYFRFIFGDAAAGDHF